ncbi:MAG TPA: RNA polymerase sigma factor [Rhodospirillales bacterium]|nr:RNA polymerase sigma factor [Rhodospirillales bacterium]
MIHNMRQEGQSRIEPYLRRLYGYAFGLAGNSHDANDLVQESALKALTAKRVPDDENAYRAWLFKILKNSFIDSLRKKARDPLPLDEEITHTQVEFFGADERIIDVVTVKLALSKLSSKHHRIISLVDIAGLSYAESAEELGIPAGTVMSRVSRARRALADLIEVDNVRPLGTHMGRRRNREQRWTKK